MSDPKPEMTDEQVHKLAHDLVTNQVFMSDRCRRVEDIPMVFMSFALAGPEIIKEYKKRQVIHLYEYFSKAGPRSINGYPCFFSNYSINSTDYKRVMAEEARMRKALEPCLPPNESAEKSTSATSKASVTSTPQSPKRGGPRKTPPSSKGSGSRKASRRRRSR